jgi:hypothetical protein
MVINLKAAKQIGLTIPPNALRASVTKNSSSAIEPASGGHL